MGASRNSFNAAYVVQENSIPSLPVAYLSRPFMNLYVHALALGQFQICTLIQSIQQTARASMNWSTFARAPIGKMVCEDSSASVKTLQGCLVVTEKAIPRVYHLPGLAKF